MAGMKPSVECGLCEICLYAADAAQSVKELIRLYKRARSVRVCVHARVCERETGKMRVFSE